jgi:hypothetical protein
MIVTGMRAAAGMLLVFALYVFTLHDVARAELIHFESCSAAHVPPGWNMAQTHAGSAPKWELVRDPSAPSPPCAFAQLSTGATAGRFPLAIWREAELRDGEVAVAFKPVAGAVDQAAGLVWRYQDPDNYYIVRANALENNVVLYKVQDGVRTSIAPKGLPSRAYGVQHPIAKGAWSNLRVMFRGSLFTVFLNNERLFEAEDKSIALPGRTGLWTKADSVIYFDDFEVVKK